MPELPEVETIRRQLAPLVMGRLVTAAEAHPSAKFAPAAQVVGATVTALTRRGKYLLSSLDDGRELVVHLGMTGRLRPRRGDEPDPYVRAWWALDDGLVLELRDIRRFGRVAVVTAGDYGALPTLYHLGPEPLGESFTPERLYRDLAGSRMAVKTQLLHQRVVAGVGNIYADEALWLAGVHPGARRVGRARAGALHAAVREVLTTGVAHGGTTLRDYRGVDGASGRNQHRLACYGRAGQPCGRCRTILRRGVVDGRGTHYCPSCQRR